MYLSMRDDKLITPIRQLTKFCEIRCLYFLFTYFPAVFNLSNGIDVEATKKKVESYKRDNKDLIQRNKLRQVREIFIELEKKRQGRAVAVHHYLLFYPLGKNKT